MTRGDTKESEKHEEIKVSSSSFFLSYFVLFSYHRFLVSSS